MANENLLTVLTGLQKSIALGHLKAVAISVVSEDDTTNLFYYHSSEDLAFLAVNHAIQAEDILLEWRKDGKVDEIGLKEGSA